jgi:hypothetical protein
MLRKDIVSVNTEVFFFMFITGQPRPDVRVHVPRVVVQVDSATTAVHAIVPVAAAEEGRKHCNPF